jgi:hypothetical protein
MTPTASQAIRNLVNNPDFSFNMDGDTIIDWDTSNIGIAQPTQSEIDAELARLQAVYDAQEYARNRKAEYNQLNQFEMQFDDDRDSTTTWVDKINEIKARYPK